MRFQPRPLPLALALLLCASAQANEIEEPVPELAPIRISASPLALQQTELATASTVLQGPKLDLRRSSTLGELLDGEVGIHVDSLDRKSVV